MLTYRPLSLLGLFLTQACTSPSCFPPPVIQLPLGNCTILSPDKEDVYSWGVLGKVDQAINVCVVPSMVLTHTFLTTEALCGRDNLVDANDITMSEDQCRSRRGGFIPSTQPLSDASTAGLAEDNPAWLELNNVIESAAEATLGFLDQAVKMVVGLIKSGQQSTASHLGLAPGSKLLQNLKDSGSIGAMSFGLNVGSQSVLFPRRGSLILGGYDQASIADSFTEYDIDNTKLRNRHCPLQVLVTGMTLFAILANGTGDKASTEEKPPLVITENADPVKYCIEPYDNLFRLPENRITSLKNHLKTSLGDPLEPSEYPKSLLNLEPGLVYPSAAGSFNGYLRITLEGGLTVDIPSHELWRPLRGLDKNGSLVLDPKYNEMQVYKDEAPQDAPVLGKAFLSQVYLFVDHESKKFRLAHQTPDVTTPLPVSSSSCPSTSGLSPTDKGLIGVGSVLGALIVALVAFALYRYCWSRKATPVAPPTPVPPSTPDTNGSEQSDAPSAMSSLSRLSEPAGVPASPVTHHHEYPSSLPGSGMGSANTAAGDGVLPTKEMPVLEIR